VARGTVAQGKRLLLLLQPYQLYDIRIRPRGTHAASFDTASRSVTLYPGNVTRVDWNITPLFILFGRAIAADGKPVANADIAGPHGIGRTDGDGYFQIEAKSGDALRMTAETGAVCTMPAASAKPVNGLAAAGDIMCR